MRNLENLLEKASLRKTEARFYVLEEIVGSKWALSHKELEDKAPKELDRVTIYRTLNTFEEKGIIHKILNDEGTAHYAICNHQCHDHHHHQDNHVHFHCQNCKKIYCLDDFNLHEIKVPKGFVIKNSDVKIQGFCTECSQG